MPTNTEILKEFREKFTYGIASSDTHEMVYHIEPLVLAKEMEKWILNKLSQHKEACRAEVIETVRGIQDVDLVSEKNPEVDEFTLGYNKEQVDKILSQLEEEGGK